MRKLRSLRRVIALATLVGWTLLQVAVNAYACPMQTGASTIASSIAGEPAQADRSAPCGEHCATQGSVSFTALPAAMPAVAVLPSIRVAPTTVAAEMFDAARQHAESRTARGDGVPLLTKLQVFRE